MRETLERLLDLEDLGDTEARKLLDRLTDSEADPSMVGAILVALRMKGEKAAEMRGFAVGLQERAIPPGIDGYPDAVDVVGTGGDGSHSFNLSTGAALLAAACGQPVIKHGNRSISSQSGSADVLDALGVGIPEPQDAGELLYRTGFTFLFAPYYHPAMKAVGPVRRALGVRTIFNLVGPLANPARPRYAVIGAASPDIAEAMALALAGMDLDRAFVIHGHDGWDEPTPAGPYHLFDVTPGRVIDTMEDPADFGIPRCDPGELVGGSPEHNAQSLRAVLEGARDGHRDAIVLGASLALRVTARTHGADEAVRMAASALDDGRALDVLHSLTGSGR